MRLPYNINCEERTDESFRRMSDSDHHSGQSILLRIIPPIDMIKCFTLDFMHLCCMGVMKKLLYENWLTGDLRIRLRPREKKEG